MGSRPWGQTPWTHAHDCAYGDPYAGGLRRAAVMVKCPRSRKLRTIASARSGSSIGVNIYPNAAAS